MAGTNKQKKISFQPFLKKSSKGASEGFFRVYLRVNFNAESTKLPSVLFDGNNLYWREEDLEKWESGDFSGSYRGEALELNRSLEFFEDIIRFEYDKDPDSFRLKGLADTARFYQQNVFKAIEEHLNYAVALTLFNNQTYSFSELANGKHFVEAATKNREKLSSEVRMLLELHLLAYLYRTAQFNSQFDLHLGSTLYHFVINSGRQGFKRFLELFFLKDKSSLNWAYLSKLLKGESMDSRYLNPLYKSFEPKSDLQDQYFKLFDQHIDCMVPTG